MLKSTFFTHKKRLSLSVSFFYVSTTRTLLRCVTWVNIFYRDTFSFCFVVQKGLESEERPRVHSSPLISLGLHARPNIGKVFEDYDRTLNSRVNNSPRNNMVTILTEAVFFLRKLFEVSLRRISAFRLECLSEFKIFINYIFPLFFAKELSVTCNCWTINPKVYTYNNVITRDNGFWRSYNNVEKNLPVFFKTEVGRTSFPRRIFGIIATKFKRDCNATNIRSQGCYLFIKPDCSRSRIISDAEVFSRWTRNLFTFFESCFGRFECLCGLHSRRDYELTWQISFLSFVRICKVMQINTINALLFPSNHTDPIKRLRILTGSVLERFWNSVNYWKFYGNCLHFNRLHILHTIQDNIIVKWFRFFYKRH